METEEIIVITVGFLVIAYFTRYIDRKFLNKCGDLDDTIEDMTGGDISLSWKGYLLFFILIAIFAFCFLF